MIHERAVSASTEASAAQPSQSHPALSNSAVQASLHALLALWPAACTRQQPDCDVGGTPPVASGELHSCLPSKALPQRAFAGFCMRQQTSKAEGARKGG